MCVIKFENINNSPNIIKQDLETAADINASYDQASPFPHVYLDNFLPIDIANRLVEEFNNCKPSNVYTRTQENKKSTYNPDKDTSFYCRSFFYALNSFYFLEWLEALTGIKGLVSDPYFNGGGLHKTENGGYLNVHADFNIHKKLSLLRRVNVLIYLNRDWQKGYGGELELWDSQMKQAVKTVEPIFNRCVIFNTTDNSYHGHPTPLNCPEGVTRKSIALYYYTASSSIYSEHQTKNTNFKVRPGSHDQKDIKIIFFDTLRDIVPPIITRNLTRLIKKAKR